MSMLHQRLAGFDYLVLKHSCACGKLSTDFSGLFPMGPIDLPLKQSLSLDFLGIVSARGM